MRIQNKARVHDACYWSAIVDEQGRKIVDRRGQPRYETPREIKVCWIDRYQVITDAGGQQRQSKAQIIVGEKMQDGEFLFRGLLTDLPQGNVDAPSSIDKASKIMRLDEFTNIKGNTTVYIVYL